MWKCSLQSLPPAQGTRKRSSAPPVCLAVTPAAPAAALHSDTAASHPSPALTHLLLCECCVRDPEDII